MAFDGVHNLPEALRHAAAAGASEGAAGGAGPAAEADLSGPGADPVAALQHLIDQRRSLPSQLRWLLSNGLWAFGASNALELVTALAAYDLTGVAPKVTCPTLVLEAEADHFFPGQPRRLYEALTCPKTLITFTAEEGGQEHCHMGALALAHQRIFDWLDETI